MCNALCTNVLQNLKKSRYVNVSCNLLKIIGHNKITFFSGEHPHMRACVRVYARACIRA